MGIGLFLGVMMLPGCASSRHIDADATTHQQTINANQYQHAFGVVREVISEYRFGINRVDISRGIITTHPKRTSGLATLWDQEQSTLHQELEEFANQHDREVRVVFKGKPTGEDSGSDQTIALGEGDGEIEMRIEVMVYRTRRPHWRIEPESVRFSTHARSRDSAGRLESSSFREAIGRDTLLEERILQSVIDQLSSFD